MQNSYWISKENKVCKKISASKETDKIIKTSNSFLLLYWVSLLLTVAMPLLT